MLKKVRVGTAIISFGLLSLLFLDFTGTLHSWFGWLAKVQFFPALLAINVFVVLALILLTWVFGRLYCSVICPLGVLQDIISWIAGKQKKNRFTYSPSISWLRYGLLALFIIAILAGFSAIASIIEPYSSFGRIVSNLFAPVYLAINNGLAYLSASTDSYVFYPADIWVKSTFIFAIAVLTFITISILAWRNGRTYCNIICPVGTFLGLFSRFSLFRPVINTEKCNGCGLCASNCKSACIDSKNHSVDYSRCVTCYNCMEKCNKKAIRYSFDNSKNTLKESTASEIPDENGNNTRRAFLSMTVLFAIAGITNAQKKIVEGGLAIIKEKKIPERTTQIAPPGSVGFKNFRNHCTACGLCISACHNQVLRPSQRISTLMLPEMSYERGYCRPECTSCSEVCPTSAITKISKEEKSAIQIGYAVWIRDNCVVLTDDVDCGNCARHCPSGAIEMVPYNPDYTESRKIPAINTERCIGCGSCENICPSRPLSAIYVEGTEIHRVV